MVFGTQATSRIEHAIDRFGLFLIVAVCLAADRLPKKNSSRPIDRAIGYAAAGVIAAVGVVGRLIDRLSSQESGRPVEDARKVTGSAPL
jgi:hypothetical protein